ncbi:MAG: prepilin peptidase [Phycisphaerae bacterium]
MQSAIHLIPVLVLLAVAAAIDLKHRRIPNWLTFALLLGGIVSSVGPWSQLSPQAAMLGAAAGFGLTVPLFALRAMGGGDVKLLTGLGAWLGPAGVLAVFIIAAVIGLFVVLFQCATRRKLTQLFASTGVIFLNLLHVRQLGVDHAAETGKSFGSIDKPLPYAVPVLVAFCFVLSL